MTTIQAATVILLLVVISFWIQKMLFTLENILSRLKKIERDWKGDKPE